MPRSWFAFHFVTGGPIWPSCGFWLGIHPHEPAVEALYLASNRKSVLFSGSMAAAILLSRVWNSWETVELQGQVGVLNACSLCIFLGVWCCSIFASRAKSSAEQKKAVLLHACFVLHLMVLNIFTDPTGPGDVFVVCFRRMVAGLLFTVFQQIWFGMVSVPLSLIPAAACSFYLLRWLHAQVSESVVSHDRPHVFKIWTSSLALAAGALVSIAGARHLAPRVMPTMNGSLIIGRSHSRDLVMQIVPEQSEVIGCTHENAVELSHRKVALEMGAAIVADEAKTVGAADQNAPIPEPELWVRSCPGEIVESAKQHVVQVLQVQKMMTAEVVLDVPMTDLADRTILHLKKLIKTKTRMHLNTQRLVFHSICLTDEAHLHDVAATCEESTMVLQLITLDVVALEDEYMLHGCPESQPSPWEEDSYHSSSSDGVSWKVTWRPEDA